MDNRSADMQAKARLLGVPLTCLTCCICNHEGGDYSYSGRDSDVGLLEIGCELGHWKITKKDCTQTSYVKLMSATTCEDFEMVKDAWIEQSYAAAQTPG